MASAPRYTLPPPQDFRLPSLKDLNFQYRSRPPAPVEDPQDIPPTRHVHQWARAPPTTQQPSPPLSAGEQYASKHDQGGYLTPGMPMSVQQQQQPQQPQQPPRTAEKRARTTSRQSQVSLPKLFIVPPSTCSLADTI